MPAQFFQIISTSSQVLILLFLAYYLMSLRSKEQELKKKEHKIDAAYRNVIEEALRKEKRILEDATNKADSIIESAQTMSTDSKKTLDLAMQKIVAGMEKDATTTAEEFMQNYQSSLKQLSTSSLDDFQKTFQSMKDDVEKQVKDFHTTQLAELQKEMEDYKQTRFDETEKLVKRVVQKVSQEVLNTSISLDDHQKLLVDSLEKARKEGMFD